MVYPALEAAMPPPLVQSFPAPVLASDASLSPTSLPHQAATADFIQAEPLQTSAELGRPLSLPSSSSPDLRFTVTPALGLLSTAQVLSPAFQRAESFIPHRTGLSPLAQQTAQPKAPANPPDLAPDFPAEPTEIKSNSFVELSSDRQEYDTLQRGVTAVGHVLLNYRQAQLKADRLQTLVSTKTVIAEGNVQLTLGNQVLQGDRLEYQLDQAQGILFKPRGIINLPSAGRDLSLPSSGNRPLVPIQDSIQQTSDSTLEAKDSIQQLRFEADRIDFTAQTWHAVNVRITSDPFSPPELELKADQAQLTRVSTREDIVTLKHPRLVFDQTVSVPIPRSKIVLSRQRQDPFPVDIGFDDRDRGGLYIERQFALISNPKVTLSITPQFFLERAIFSRNFNLIDPDIYGLSVKLKSTLSSKTTFSSFISLSSFDVTKVADNLRAGLLLEQKIGNNSLNVLGAYRERILNGSLGEQTIQSRVGAIFISPTQKIGQTGIDFSYRLGAELITANTDVFGGLTTDTLGRFQGSASLQRAFDLWTGKTLPSTPTQGLKYTPKPIQPYFRLVAGVTGVTSVYSNRDTQASLMGSIRFEGQFGHFSRKYLDYTGFYVGFSQGIQGGSSPFLFDRVVDQQVFSAGFLQQIYGPVRLGFQTSINLETGEFFNTDIVLDYSRRTYGVILRYNPNLQIGSLEFRINSFNWVSNRDPLTAPEIGVVDAGVDQINRPF